MPVLVRQPLRKDSAERAEVGTAPYWLRDATVPGLALRVLPSGRKSYAVLWGRGKAHTIGAHPVMTLEGARTTAKRVLAEIAEHGAPLGKHGVGDSSLGDFIERQYGPHVEATAKQGKATVAALQAVFADWMDLPLSKITLEHWDKLKADRLRADIQPATVNRDLDRIKAALSQAVAWGRLDANPLAKVKRIRRGIEPRVRYLSAAEEKRLRKALEAREKRRRSARVSGETWRQVRGKEPLGAFKGYTDHLMPLTLLALNTGLRRGELTQLRWSDIDLKAKRLTVRAGYAKSGQARHIPLNTEALAVVRVLRRRGQGDAPLFEVVSLPKSWANLTKAAKLEDFRFHDLRHTFASKLVMAGVDLNTVRELLGHGDIQMTLRYAHLAPAKLAEAVAKLA